LPPYEEDQQEQAKVRRWPYVLIVVGVLTMGASGALFASCDVPARSKPCTSGSGGFCVDERFVYLAGRNLLLVTSLLGVLFVLRGLHLRARRLHERKN
jgi:hypothetical protein